MAPRRPLPATFPDLVSLDVFTSAVRLGSLSAAAAAHGISQPSASARIRALERQVGVTLLHRSPSGSTPTEQGALIAEWAEDVLVAADRLAAGAATLRTTVGPSLHVLASFTVAEFLLPRWVTTWRRQHEGRALEMTVANSTAVIERVRAGTATIGFVESPGPIRGLRTQEIGSDELVVVVAASHPWARRRQPLTEAQLAAAPFVVREAGSGTREAFRSALAGAGVSEPPAMVELGSTTAIRETVASGAGPAALSRLAVSADLASGRLVEVAATGVDLTRPLRAVWSAQRPPDADERSLIDIAASNRPDPG